MSEREKSDQLGPLPDSDWTGGTLAYTAEQMHAYAAQQVASERERIAALVEAVRDANAAEANGDYPFRVLTSRQETAWTELMAWIEAPNAQAKPGPTQLDLGTSAQC